ncbi:MAG: dCTP deaminase [Kiritimatiellia bacterium]
MIKNDTWIAQAAREGMITPFEPTLVSQVEDRKVLSFGLSSYGYDIRLSPNDFRIFRHIPGTVIDPKAFNPANLESVPLHEDAHGKYFILPAHSYGLGVALEALKIPDSISVLCIGKSTYARVGCIANLTPAEAGWEGHLTLEFSNASHADCRIYAEEGIVQLLFFEGDPCETSYARRKGKYQHQTHEVTLPRV